MFNVRIQFEKRDGAAYISHLDLMKTLQRALLRAQLPVKYTEGFNPHIYLSILVPLSTGYQSEYDLFDFTLLLDTCPDGLADRLNQALPQGLRAVRAGEAKRPVSQIAYCGYEIHYHSPWDPAIAGIFQQPVKILKHSKRGDREVVLNDYVRTLAFQPEDGGFCCTCQLKAGGDPLNPSYITDVLRFHNLATQEDRPFYIRKSILDENGEIFF